MKTRNDNHLQMANQESNIDQGGDKMSLLKTFNSKGLKKSCSLFLSSIVTLSILSVANSSFAFPALVRKNETLSLYYAPSTSRFKRYQKYTQLIGLTLVDVLYCRDDGWCYIAGYYSKGTTQRPGYIPEKAWAISTQLCERADNLNTTPLIECGSNTSRKYDRIVASNKKNYQDFFCAQGKSGNPWRWLFVYMGKGDFCKRINQYGQ